MKRRLTWLTRRRRKTITIFADDPDLTPEQIAFLARMRKVTEAVTGEPGELR
jgi:hypothetical protein